MIDARELRIGNYIHTYIRHEEFVHHSEYDKSICVVDADTIKILSRKHKPKPPYKDAIGIQTTEEWLINKVGFERVKPKRGIQRAYKKKSVRIEMSNSGNFSHKGKVKNYIHKIQNLYYELEDEELTIKD